MLKQSFTAENFRKIFDYENRKGADLERKFFPNIVKINQKLKKNRKETLELRKRKSKLPEEKYEKEKTKYGEERSALKQKKERVLTEELERISAKTADKNFKIRIRRVSPTSGKTAYSIENNDPASYFATKQIQYNFRKLYKVKQSNRYDIIRQLTNVLDNNLPKCLIRTDIRDFYESIPKLEVLKKINKDLLLTPVSRNIIWHILNEYQNLSGNNTGIPRGIGISAYLSELHMRSFDEAMMSCQDVAYYARYVDDIVLVFFLKNKHKTPDYLDFIKEEMRKRCLKLNDGKEGSKNKTKKIDLLLPGNKNIEYLGYRINFGGKNKSPKLDMSRKKINRYKKRINLAFEQQKLRERTNKKIANKILVKRMLFLSGNTRLVGRKQHVLVGIYYSNSLLAENSNSLKELDEYLQQKTSKLQDGWLKRRLEKISFIEGFTRRNFIKFSTKELSKIIEVWKHEA